jgi:HD-GYP domain-containing protein (c-di-GMP phosphodiesterase class II)
MIGDQATPPTRVLTVPNIEAVRTSIGYESLRALARMIEAGSPRLADHGDRTARYALKLGDAVGLTARELIDLYFAALLHDIGLLTLPPEILEKEGPLTAEEYALLQSHPRAGAQLLEPIDFLRTPAIWIAHHHERWDGYGYPYGLRGECIPLGSRILAVADTFDALLVPSSSKRALDFACALELLRLVAGTQLDAALVQTFCRLAPDMRAPCNNPMTLPGWGVPPHPAGQGAHVPPGPPAHPLPTSNEWRDPCMSACVGE